MALSAAVIATLSSILLAFALYATLKPVNNLLAQLAMIFCVGDSLLGLIVRMCSFVRLHLYISPEAASDGNANAQLLSDVIRNIAGTPENIGGVAFGTGTLLFFYLFFKSRYIPRIFSSLGLFASAVWIAVYFAGFVFPERHAAFQSICFSPMALAEVTTGFYLMLFVMRTKTRGDDSARTATPGRTL
ncbi:MAG: DUF4386 domain-containing protein [Acidobacteriaceae bacterium]|nr:DUF4386 domain-containing protein [Acidobacteriaceae bacterium]